VNFVRDCKELCGSFPNPAGLAWNRIALCPARQAGIPEREIESIDERRSA
jgi:hypothetical protein